MVDTLLPGEIAGFDVYGVRQADGTIKIGTPGHERIIPEWPSEIELNGVVYTGPEEIKRIEAHGLKQEWALYV